MLESNKKIQETRERMMDACIAKRAKIIDCNTCSHQTICDFIWSQKEGVEVSEDQKLIELSLRYDL